MQIERIAITCRAQSGVKGPREALRPYAGSRMPIEGDYVVVGAGSAGCVVASRLSEDGARVVLLEAGGPDRDIWIHVPAGVLRVLNNTKINWNFLSEGESG